MANDEIVGKLARYTYAELEDEAAAVYLIVQIGKIIEREESSQDFPVLCFYRDWVVHPKLDRNRRDGRTEMLGKLNEAVLAVIERRGHEVLERFEGAVSLKKLQKEIARFVQKYQLQRPNFDYVPWFKKFEGLLVSVLVDLPLIPSKDLGYAFTEFRFKKSNADAADAEFEVDVLKSANGGKPMTIKGKLRTGSEHSK